MDKLKEIMIDANTELLKRKAKEKHTLYEIALVKSYSYSQEYNRYSGQVEDKEGYPYLKQGYIAGFMAGFAHKMGGGHD